MKYTLEERLDIGRRIYDGELTKYAASEQFGISNKTQYFQPYIQARIIYAAIDNPSRIAAGINFRVVEFSRCEVVAYKQQYPGTQNARLPLYVYTVENGGVGVCCLIVHPCRGRNAS